MTEKLYLARQALVMHCRDARTIEGLCRDRDLLLRPTCTVIKKKRITGIWGVTDLHEKDS